MVAPSHGALVAAAVLSGGVAREPEDRSRWLKQARLKQARLYKCKLWWEFAKAFPYRITSDMDATHARAGLPARQWEDLLVDLRGAAWREIRDKHENSAAWRITTDACIDEIWIGISLLCRREAATQH